MHDSPAEAQFLSCALCGGPRSATVVVNESTREVVEVLESDAESDTEKKEEVQSQPVVAKAANAVEAKAPETQMGKRPRPASPPRAVAVAGDAADTKQPESRQPSLKKRADTNAFMSMMGNSMARQRDAPLKDSKPSAAPKYRPPARELEGCSLDDPVRAQELLQRDGVVVFKNVASAAELAAGEGLFWEWLEATEVARKVGLRRDQPHTHKSSVFKELGYANTGVMSGGCVGQSAFMWHVRMLPGVRRAFANIWGLADNDNGSGTRDRRLVTSFDGCGSWRNYWLHGGRGSGTATEGNWYIYDIYI